MTTRIISGRNLLRQYNELKAAGWTTVWAGNGRICLRAPEPGAELPEAPVVVVEMRTAGAEVISNG